jgi:hypothetical protein
VPAKVRRIQVSALGREITWLRIEAAKTPYKDAGPGSRDDDDGRQQEFGAHIVAPAGRHPTASPAVIRAGPAP